MSSHPVALLVVDAQHGFLATCMRREETIASTADAFGSDPEPAS